MFAVSFVVFSHFVNNITEPIAPTFRILEPPLVISYEPATEVFVALDTFFRELGFDHLATATN